MYNSFTVTLNELYFIVRPNDKMAYPYVKTAIEIGRFITSISREFFTTDNREKVNLCNISLHSLRTKNCLVYQECTGFPYIIYTPLGALELDITGSATSEMLSRLREHLREKLGLVLVIPGFQRVRQYISPMYLITKFADKTFPEALNIKLPHSNIPKVCYHGPDSEKEILPFMDNMDCVFVHEDSPPKDLEFRIHEVLGELLRNGVFRNADGSSQRLACEWNDANKRAFLASLSNLHTNDIVTMYAKGLKQAGSPEEPCYYYHQRGYAAIIALLYYSS